MEITKEVFFKFLKDNNFYDGWMEGYDLDNRIFNDYVSLDEFFSGQRQRSWLYGGPGSMSMICFRPSDPDLQKSYDEWRNKYLSLYMDLDEKWMSFCKESLG